MDIRKEYKFALPTSFGLLFGVITGSLFFFVILGTVVGLVWGYSDHMLLGKPTHKSVSKTRKTHKKSSSKKSTKSKAKRK